MPLVTDLIQKIPDPMLLILGVFLLLGGGFWLVEGAVSIARRMGVSTLVIGLTIVAFGTSAPELALNINASITGYGGLSFGNVVGSNIANIGLVLGAAAITCPLVVHSRVIKKELPQLLLVSIAAVLLAWLPVTRITGGEVGYSALDGAMMIVAFVVFAWTWFRAAQSDRADTLPQEAEERAREEPNFPMTRATMLFLSGLGLLLLGGEFTKSGAVGLARAFGISDALIGLTIVAVATSLPELVSSIIAARKGHGDLAVGNVIGSNLFNLLLVLGVTAMFGEVPVPGAAGWLDLAVMLGLTFVLVPIALTHQQRITSWEGIFLLVCYTGYMLFAVTREFGDSAAATP